MSSPPRPSDRFPRRAPRPSARASRPDMKYSESDPAPPKKGPAARVPAPGSHEPAPVYYEKEGDILYRRRDGNKDLLPDEVLHRAGWVPLVGQLTVSPDAHPKPSRRGGIDGSADPTLWFKISQITEDEAREIVRTRRPALPLDGW